MKCVFILQPFLLEEEAPVFESESAAWGKKPDSYRNLVKLYYDRVRHVMADFPNFIDLSGCLKGRKEPHFVDQCHLNDVGRLALTRCIILELQKRGLPAARRPGLLTP